jgi:drug/metabolite transporter (DMT)-like permease
MKRHGLLEIHIAVILFGLSGLFGKFLTLPPLIIVFGRTFFAALTLSIIIAGFKIPFRVKSRRDFFVLILLGVILAVHWITFFHSIQISTVAVGLLTFSTFPIFVTFMEPVFFKEKIRIFDILTAGSVVFGLLWVIPSFDLQKNITLGAFWGILSGFTFAVLSILNRKYVSTYPPMLMVCCQNGTATMVLLPFLFLENWALRPADYVLLPILGIFCTAAAHVLFIKSLVHIKTQLASITAGLEPVYGIIFAVFLLGEIPDARTVLGGGIILGTIALATLKRPST